MNCSRGYIFYSVLVGHEKGLLGWGVYSSGGVLGIDLNVEVGEKVGIRTITLS